MAGNLSGYINIVPMTQPSSMDGTLTSPYIKLDKYDKVCFIVQAGSGLGDTGQLTCGLYSAHAADSSGATAIAVYTTMGSTAAKTVSKAQAVLLNGVSSWDHGEYLTLNGVTFTAYASDAGGASLTTASFDSNRYVVSSSGGTGGSATCQHLAAYINHAVYGCPGVNAIVYGNPIATASSNNVYVHGMGEAHITVVASTSAVACVPVSWVSVLETNGAELLANTSHKYVACVVSGTSAVKVSITAIRSGLRYSSGPEGVVTDYDFGV